jgi:hypothetical protein
MGSMVNRFARSNWPIWQSTRQSPFWRQVRTRTSSSFGDPGRQCPPTPSSSERKKGGTNCGSLLPHTSGRRAASTFALFALIVSFGLPQPNRKLIVDLAPFAVAHQSRLGPCSSQARKHFNSLGRFFAFLSFQLSVNTVFTWSGSTSRPEQSLAADSTRLTLNAVRPSLALLQSNSIRPL